MNNSDIAARLQPEIIARFRRAIETGKWPDGSKLSQEQKEICLQAVITYEHHNLPEDERTGYVPSKKTACARDEHGEQPLKWRGLDNNTKQSNS